MRLVEPRKVRPNLVEKIRAKFLNPASAGAVESHERRNGASDDFIGHAQSPLAIRLNCGDSAFFVPSCWFCCLSFTGPALAPFRLLCDSTGLVGKLAEAEYFKGYLSLRKSPLRDVPYLKFKATL